MIYGPQYSHSYINRIQPVDKDPTEERDPNKKKKVRYQGRFWNEQEKSLPIQPKLEISQTIKARTSVYIDPALLEKAKKMFEKLTTLEEKIAQLFFLETEAIYDTGLQREIEILLQTYQMGGVLFKKGEYKRQLYLIERFQEIAKTPLLFANDFAHGLFFYLQGDAFKQNLSLQHFTDLGKTIMNLNRRMGVQIQFDRNRKKGEKNQMSDEQAKAFRKGIRDAQGIVGKQKALLSYEGHFQISKDTKHPFSLMENLFDHNIQEFVGYKVVTFYDFTTESVVEENLLHAYRKHYDLFLVSKDQIAQAMHCFYRFFLTGKISEEDLDRRLMKILVVKALFF